MRVYNPNTIFYEGDEVVYQGLLYTCLYNGVSGPFDPTKFAQLNLKNNLVQSNTNSLFDFKFHEYHLNEISWVLSNFEWIQGKVYTQAYAHLLEDKQNATITTRNIEGISITFYLAQDGHRIVDAQYESVVQSIYDKTGIAWFYILDTENKLFKLPRSKWAFVGNRNEVGGYVEAGLPNITGELKASYAPVYSKLSTGAFSSSLSGSGTNGPGNGQGGASNSLYEIPFDASRSNPTYGKSDTVQQKATEMYLYFYLGNFSREAIEQTAGLNAESLNNKADIDLSNINEAGKTNIANTGIPDYTQKQIISNGFIATSNGFIFAFNKAMGWKIADLKINNILVGFASGGDIVQDPTSMYAIVKKGDVITFTNMKEVAFYPFINNI